MTQGDTVSSLARSRKEKKGRKRKGKPGKGEYEDSVGVEWGDFFFKVQRSDTNPK
jgi:hypothetical protein